MIVYEKEESFILIAQHDHARISGDLVSAWQDELFHSAERREELAYAAYEHDSSWIDLDRIPLWNDAVQAPFSFRDYPGNIRFFFYSRGLDRVQETSEYAALLGSILYTTLAERFRNEDTVPFVEREFSRQSAIIERLQLDVKLLQLHAKALLLCDELSLFVCMDQPGTPRQNYEWFANGFPYWFDRSGQTSLIADWKDHSTITLDPFPFSKEVEASLFYKEVSKASIGANGIAAAYQREQLKEHKLIFRSKRIE
ncbi:hypothetical protein BK133_19550 [Paenibacillus sp. FSL H8-0548]|uniref:DUF3891 family protein n=1 Tax=Paenibacillus sp. FSL H8-0548 TaxID=1920422 RepID=UPI00096E3863|nr:DUF3891 family protein [Paenibacillus sp. FSL H8-0548]OMF27156.1 hypothetical protein BK133_19550 [Paenibacillus sp. FSL H8-0548]